MKRYIIYSLAVFILAGTSCKKFIEDSSQDQIIPKTTTDFIELLYGQGYPSYSGSSPIQKELEFLDDDVACWDFNTTSNSYLNTQGASLTNDLAATLTWHSWQPNAYEQYSVSQAAGSKDFFNPWKNYYALILGTNLALDNADGSDGTDADKAYLKGQAYGLRAFYYFMLVNLYGKPYNDKNADPSVSLGVPLVLSSSYTNASAYPKRNTVKEVYERIAKDLDSSIYFLEKGKKVYVYRMNHVAAHLLASRVYLYMEDWDKVITHASAVVSERPDLMNVTAWPTPNPASAPVLGATGIETLWAYGSYGDYTYISTTNPYRLSDDLLSKFGSGNTDKRKGVFVIEFSSSDKTKYGYNYYDGKYVKSASTQNTAKAFRVAEAYLNRAEAYAELYKKQGSNAQDALNDLNTLRQKRINPYTAWTLTGVSADSLITACREERRRELFLEDHRWFDLRRYGMPSISHIVYDVVTKTPSKYVLKQNDPQYTLAIPEEVLGQNMNLIQNELAPQRLPE